MTRKGALNDGDRDSRKGQGPCVQMEEGCFERHRTPRRRRNLPVEVLRFGGERGWGRLGLDD